MKRLFSIILALVMTVSLGIPAFASTSAEDEYTIVDGIYWISVTEDQFNEFTGDTNIEELIEKYSLVRELAPVAKPEPNAENMRISSTRASTNITAHELPVGGMFYYDTNGNEFLVKAGGTFKITARFTGGPKYASVNMGYNDGISHFSTGMTSGQSASFKFTQDKYVKGFLQPSINGVTPYQITSGNISW